MVGSLTVQHVGKRLRELRVARGLSVRTLATRAGFSASFISQVELGHTSPSIDSLERIAGALGVSLSGFFATTGELTSTVVYAEDRQTLSSAWSRASIEALSPVGRSGQLEAILVTFEPGGRRGAQPHVHARDEFAMVFEGQMMLLLGDETHYLDRGDAVLIPAGLAHHWVNLTLEPTRVVIVATRFTDEMLTAADAR